MSKPKRTKAVCSVCGKAVRLQLKTATLSRHKGRDNRTPCTKGHPVDGVDWTRVDDLWRQPT